MIIASFTTIPERLKKGLPEICINSLLKQSIKPDHIIINVPEISKNGELYSKDLAKQLELISPIVTVQFGVQDLGPITKIVPTLSWIKNKNRDDAVIILIDDDCIYEPCMIETIIKIKTSKPDELVIGTGGRIKQNSKLEHTGVTNYNNLIAVDHIYVDIIETFAGVMYDYKLFKDTNFESWITEFPEYVMWADDIILSTWAKKQGAKLYKIIQNRSIIVKHDPKKTTELNFKNDFGGNNERVYDYFEELEIKERFETLLNKSKNNSFSDFTSNQKVFKDENT
jgi:hypothetical protein